MRAPTARQRLRSATQDTPPVERAEPRAVGFRPRCPHCRGQVVTDVQPDGSAELTCMLCSRAIASLPPPREARWQQELAHVRTLSIPEQQRYWGGDKKLGRPCKVSSPEAQRAVGQGT